MANEVVVEDENEGTILTFDDAENVSAEDIMYLLQGTGSNRDRKISLEALMEWIAERLESGQTLESLLFSKDHTSFKNISFIDGDGIEINNAQNDSEEALTESLLAKLKTDFLQFAKTANSVLRETVHTADGLEFRRGSGSDKTKATISLDLTTNKLQIQVSNGLEINGAQLEPERLNLGSVKSYFEISADSNINTLLSNSGIATQKGDIVTLYNNSQAYHTVTLGQRTGLGTMTTTIEALCAMSFICVYADQTYEWAPMCSVTVNTSA